MILLFILIIIGLVVYILVSKSKTNNIIQEKEIPIKSTDDLPYAKKYLLTKNEWFFYKELKPVADELGYTILSKVRMADLVEVKVKDNKDYLKYFNKINKKHIDFILAKPENLQIVLLIELDDNSHNTAQKDRDLFIEQVYEKTGYKILRVRGAAGIKEKIFNILNPQPNVDDTPSTNSNPLSLR